MEVRASQFKYFLRVTAILEIYGKNVIKETLAEKGISYFRTTLFQL